MSLETSTDKPEQGLQAWQFFVLAGLACATVATFLARGQSVASIVLLTVLMGATTIVGIAALRMLRPLFLGYDDRTAMVGQRTRAALEREKMLVLRSIKELEFDRAMGKLSENDWQEMSERLRARAAAPRTPPPAGGRGPAPGGAGVRGGRGGGPAAARAGNAPH